MSSFIVEAFNSFRCAEEFMFIHLIQEYVNKFSIKLEIEFSYLVNKKSPT